MDSLFGEIKRDKCNRCVLDKKDLIIKQVDDVTVHKKGNCDILILLEMPEGSVYEYFLSFLEHIELDNYWIVLSLECRSKNFKLPNPAYAIYKNCLPYDIDELNPKAVLTVGRSLYSITQTDDIIGWGEFREYLFNQTYLKKPLKNKRMLRVYPIPMLSEWVQKDNYERFFASRQINEIKKWVEEDYEEEILKRHLGTEITDCETFFQKHKDEKEIAIDTETNGFDHFAPNFKVGCVTLTFDGVRGYYISTENLDVKAFSEFIKNKYQIWANVKFDWKAFDKLGVTNIRADEDVILLFHLLNTDRRSKSIKALAWLLGFGGYDVELGEYRKKYKIKDYLKIPKHILMPYAILDPIVTFRLYKFGMELVKKQPAIYDVYKKIILPSIEVFKDMETTGILIDKMALNELTLKIKNLCGRCEFKIKETLGNHDINLNSTEDLGRALEEQGWPNLGRSTKKFYIDKNGQKRYYYKADEGKLLDWQRRGYKLATDLISYRQWNKLLTTYLGKVSEKQEESLFIEEQEQEQGIVKFISNDGRVHSSFGVAMTNSGRSNSRDPNVQNTPKQDEIAKDHRRIYRCPDGYYICEADYTGFQLRIGGIYSGDPTMEDIFLNRGGDMHSITARSVFARDLTIEEFLAKKKEFKYKNYRFRSKSINFGFLFGAGPSVIIGAIINDWTEDERNEYIKINNLKIEINKDTKQEDKPLTIALHIRKQFFETYNGLQPWIKSCHEFGKEHGYIDAVYHGLRRHLPTLTYEGKDVDKSARAKLLNICVNSPVQAFEAIEIYEAMTKIYHELKKRNFKTKMVNMVHDSLVLYVYKPEAKEVYYILKQSLSNNRFKIPIECEVEYGNLWGFSEEVTEENLHEFAT